MSLPRRAVKEVGLQVCCLLCDEPDKSGSGRCRVCISHHRKIRDTLNALPPESKIRQLASELLQFARYPEKFTHDPVHGPILERYIELIGAHDGPAHQPTTEEIAALFAAAAKTDKSSPLRNIANLNPYWENPLDVEVAKREATNLGETSEVVRGITKPSRPIPEVDRSDRLGEVSEMVDRLESEAMASSAPAPLKEVIAAEALDKKRAKREDWADTLEELDDMLNGNKKDEERKKPASKANVGVDDELDI